MAKIRSKQPDADAGRVIVDEQLEELEARLSSMYAQASKEVKDKFDNYLNQYAATDKQMRADLESGNITEDEYKDWQNRRIWQTEKTAAQLSDINQRMINADKQAASMINNELPEIYATSYNFGGFRGETYAQAAGYDYTQFTILNEDAVKTLAKEDPDLIPWKIDPNLKEDEKWNRQHLQAAIQQGIIQGDSMDKIAERLLPVVRMNENAAIRTARTAVNGIENKGRKDAVERVKEAGIPMVEMWSCTHDARTRDTHILLDKTLPNDKGLFGEGILSTLIEYPGDPSGDPEEVYNCRCALVSSIKGIDHSKDDELYEKMMSEQYFEDWQKVKEQRNEKEQAFQDKKEGARERVDARNERRAENQASEPIKEPFVPAKTIQEAEEYASRFAENVDYSRLSIDKANQINETLTNLTEKYPIKPLEEIKQKGGSQAASANFKHLYVNGQKMGKTLNEESENFLLKQEQMRQTIEDIKGRYPEGRIPQVMQNKIDDLENRLQFERWGVLDSYPNKIDALITHEYGHIIADQYFVQNSESSRKDISHFTYQPIKEEWKSIYKQAYSNGDIYKMSEYAGTNEKEYFAECFAARELGETIPDYVEDFMERRILSREPL